MHIEGISAPSDVFGSNKTILSQRNISLSDGSTIHLDSDMETETDVFLAEEGDIIREGYREEPLDPVLFDTLFAADNGGDPIEAAFGDD
jgi:hypothetical protein